MAIATVASMAMQAGSMSIQNQANKQSEATALWTAKHNAAIDIEQAQQLDMDTLQNIRASRADDKVYLSHQATAYAASGVLMSGSPLSVMATTAGKLEQRNQQMYVNSEHKQQEMYSAAQAGLAYGQASAQATSIQNDAQMLSGGAHLLSTAANTYQSGGFNFSTGSKPVSPGGVNLGEGDGYSP